MGKLTKLKENFKLENIKEETKKALEKIGMGMIKTAAAATIALTLAGGFMSCDLNPEIDYCDVCAGIQDEYHEHEQGGTEQGGTEQGGTEQGGTGDNTQTGGTGDNTQTGDNGQGGTGTEGGNETGGNETGGNETGGNETGGNETGGNETGGNETGGNETGGNETGGNETGGNETGGNETGGNETGGNETGGNENESGNGNGSTGGTESWFKPVSIGNNDLYQVFVPEHSFNEHNKLVEGSVDNYLDQYQKYVESLSLNKELTGDVEIDFARIKAMAGTSEQYKLDTLIGTTSNTDSDTIKGINNVCKSAIENIMNNIGSGDTVVVDRAYFAIYYKAIANEAYRIGYNGELTTKNQNGTYDTNSVNKMQNHYNQEKINCLNLLYNEENLPFQNKYLYDESGNLNPELVQQFDEMVVTTADKLGIDPDKARNIMKLSFTASVIEGMHDDLSTNNTIDHTHTDSCYNNEIYEVVIEPIAFPSLTMAQPTKLNKLNFNKDFGRELC